jgi:hypothetical protein
VLRESAFQAVWSLRRSGFGRASLTSGTPIYPLTRLGRAELGLPRTGTPALGGQISRTCSSTPCLTAAEPGHGNLELTTQVDHYPTDWSFQLTGRCQLRRDGVPPLSMDHQLTSFSIVKP